MTPLLQDRLAEILKRCEQEPKQIVSNKQLHNVAEEYGLLQKHFIPVLIAIGHFKNGWNSAEAYYFRTSPKREKRTENKQFLDLPLVTQALMKAVESMERANYCMRRGFPGAAFADLFQTLVTIKKLLEVGSE